MIIVLKREATPETAQELLDKIAGKGLTPLHMPGSERVVLGALGDERILAELHLESHPMVESVKPVLQPYKLVSRELHPHDTIVRIGRMAIGGGAFCVIAGPPAVESEEQIGNTAKIVKEAGASALRSGPYQPRSGPYGSSRDGPAGLTMLRAAANATDMPVVTEVMDMADLETVSEQADCLEVGASNMSNFALLRAIGRVGKPVLLRRGVCARIEEMLLAAEHLLASGNEQVVLCEGGIRTFETATRNTLDLNSVPHIKQKTHLPVVVDPSHGTGNRDLVIPMAVAAAACGADGLIVDVHENPAIALSEGAQSLYPEGFRELMTTLAPVVRAVGRELA